jgi:hypothetical protein
MPTAESYQKAVDLVCSAVKHDTEKNVVAAFNLYCDSLRYFIPLINGRFYFMTSIKYPFKFNG